MPEQDAIQMLKDDHETVRGLLEELTKASSGDKRSELLQKIKREIKIHSKLEEELFYPAFEKETDTKESHITVLESLEEHGLADRVLAELEGVDAETPEFQAKAQVLKELVEHHADDEEDEMLPKAKKVMSKKRLDALGEDMATRKQELQENYEEEIEAQ